MAITLPDARQLSDDVLEALRLRALHGRESGFTEADLANLLGVSRETVCRWWSAYAAHGIDALPHRRAGRPPGTGRLLPDHTAGPPPGPGPAPPRRPAPPRPTPPGRERPRRFGHPGPLREPPRRAGADPPG